MKAVLVDDERSAQVVMQELLKLHCPEVEICGIADNIIVARELILKHQPSLVFLDIRMPGGSAFDLLKSFDEIPFRIIFATSHHEYAINAIRVNALDYLLKPIDIDELKAAVQKVNLSFQQSDYRTRMDNLVNHLQDTDEKKIPVHTNQQVLLIPEKNILLLEGDGNYTHLTTHDGKKYTLGKTLKEVELYFSSGKLLRIRRELIINSAYILSYSKSDPFTIELENGVVVEVSRRKRQEILSILKG